MNQQAAQSLEPTAICAALSDLHLGGSDPFVDGEFQGAECRIFKISFKDRPSLSVRVYHRLHLSQQEVIASVDMDTRMLRTLEEKGFPWSPRYRAASLTFDNPINYPFVVLDWVEGVPLQWDHDSPAQPIRDAFLAQLAAIQLSLVTCTLENRSTTATAFFERRIRNQLNRVKDGKLPGLVEKDCLDQLALLPKALGPDGHNTLFAVDHADLKPKNIIVDQENNIKCIIGWSAAAMVPIVQAARLPCFLWSDDSATRVPSQAMLRDRKSYIDLFPAQDSQASLLIQRWQRAKDVDFRMLYLASISSKGMLASMASIGWKPSYCKLIEEA
ncbi:hypothetical protein MY1884_001800 [Beauveria asiatica]